VDIRNAAAVVTGGASGLGLATAKKLLAQGAKVVLADLPTSDGAAVAASLGPNARFAAADVTSEAQMQAAFNAAAELGPVRATVHCAGRGGPLRILDKNGEPGALETYETVIRINLVGSFNVLRLAAAAMAKGPEVDGERGVVVMTASVAAWEGQIGQIHYASSKAGIVGMTLVAARDLAQRKIRVCTIAPGVFDTPILARLGDDGKRTLAQAIPNPARLGDAVEFAMLAAHIIENPYLNGETIRLDGALRMAPR
jgi:NAD(P)-dependent dehydrogenase (short-subunit alcohol dehydrogenase family)